MTDVKNSRLYKTLKKAVRKQDHAELLRMLEMVRPDISKGWLGMDSKTLVDAFGWTETPQGGDYWAELSDRLHDAGHDCY
jgi:hypothetical protein